MAESSEGTVKKKRGTGKPFAKGRSGNPGGRPKANPEAKEILKAATPDAARKLVELLGSRTEKIALAAATEILDRTMGRPETTGKLQVDQTVSMNVFDEETRARLLEMVGRG